jgi:predicted metal-dependent peptidase
MEEVLNVAVTIDTSGSISDDDLIEFFAEIKAIHKNGARVTVIEADCAVCRTYEFRGKFDGAVHGRGGTDLDPAMAWVDKQKKFDAHIYFTDFYAPKFEKRYRTPVLWILTSEMEPEGYPCDYGRKVNLRSGRPV